ncbi:epoxide hydrolase 1-like isoform X3 [Stegostoma tigrinum]|uniref:epoxide hydrolase 1-like isoform X3 n=1 Tax=Stegostoma tigrinum TaxID=3053191 RepID=UPI00202AF610|nr:epoxide hydrolase 1-like isoform X3 [Stegostoma tigrinum]
MTMLLTESPWSDSFIFLLIFTIVVGILLYYYFFHENPKTIPEGDGWWGARERQDTQEDETVHSFTIETFEEMIQDLHYRLDHTRFTPPLEDSRFQYGFNSNYLRKVVSYWRKDYNWKKQLEILNQFPHFRTRIEGIDIHFVHVKPRYLPSGQTAIPLMMIHGWPGSFYEFYKIIPQLTDPVSHSLSQQETFEIICPSIPGYGFSEAPHKKGFNSIAAARVFCKLMRRLGFDRFYVQGGDWGSLIATNMAQMKPQNVKGIHLNFFPNSRMGLKILPSLLLGRKFSLDELLTNVMIYWVSGSITSSMRLYKENLGADFQNRVDDKVGVYVPVGMAAFPNELIYIPLAWARQKYKKIMTFSYMSCGGHFAAFEEPDLLAEDLRNFVQTVEKSS